MKALLGIPESFLYSLGILDWGYTNTSAPQSFDKYDEWVRRGGNGPLTYLSDERKDLRKDLKSIYPEFQSALVFLFSYQPTKKWMLENNRHEVAAYSLGFEGADYHYVLKEKLDQIFHELKKGHPDLERFIALDAQPVLERDLAFRSGLGWFGKNSMLIHQKEGSYFILGSLLLNQELQLENPKLDIDHCGQCNACVDACPTNAIDPETRTLKASACISTYTIEIFKDAPAPEGFDKSRGEIFGCDICQDVCPWNRKPLGRVEGKLSLAPAFTFLKEWFYEISQVQFKSILESESKRGLRKKLSGTPFDRPGRDGWLKNLK